MESKKHEKFKARLIMNVEDRKSGIRGDESNMRSVDIEFVEEAIIWPKIRFKIDTKRSVEYFKALIETTLSHIPHFSDREFSLLPIHPRLNDKEIKDLPISNFIDNISRLQVFTNPVLKLEGDLEQKKIFQKEIVAKTKQLTYMENTLVQEMKKRQYTEVLRKELEEECRKLKQQKNSLEMKLKNEITKNQKNILDIKNERRTNRQYDRIVKSMINEKFKELEGSFQRLIKEKIKPYEENVIKYKYDMDILRRKLSESQKELADYKNLSNILMLKERENEELRKQVSKLLQKIQNNPQLIRHQK